MTDGASRARRWRAQRTARGECHGAGCTAAARGYYCDRCARARSPQNAAQFRSWWLTNRFLEVMVLLAQNKCVVCRAPKERFEPWTCRGCREKLRAA